MIFFRASISYTEAWSEHVVITLSCQKITILKLQFQTHNKQIKSMLHVKSKTLSKKIEVCDNHKEYYRIRDSSF